MFFTQNPIGSSATEDLQDNAISFDYAMNSPAALWQDRFGKQHKTVQQALKDVGFKPAGFDFVSGGTLDIGDRDKCVFYPTDGYWYSWNGKLPYVVPANSSPTAGGKKGWKVTNLTNKNLIDSATVSVGPGGDFTTLNDALRFITRSYNKIYEPGSLTPTPGYGSDTISVTINLKSGFVMEEQIILRQTKLGWITIVSEDPIVSISRKSLSKATYFLGTGSEMYPCFYAGDNSELPVLAVKFEMDETGEGLNRHFLVVNRNSSAHLWPYSGCLNAGGHGIYAREGSTVSCRLVICDGAKDTGFIAANQSSLSAHGGSAKKCKVAVTATDSSFVNFAGGQGGGSELYGVNCIEGSSVNCSTADLTSAGKYGIRASNCIKVSGYGVNISDAKEAGVWADQGSVVSIENGKSDRSPLGIRADSGSTVVFNGGSAIFCSSRAIHALSSRVHASDADLTSAGTNSVLANIGSTVTLINSKCRKGLTDSNTDIAIGNGSIIAAAGATGGFSVPINTLSRDGFISF